VTSTGPLRLFDVRDTALSVDEVIHAVADPRAGGVAVFIGMVRNHSGDDSSEGGGETGETGEGSDGDEGVSATPAVTPTSPSPVTSLEYIAHPSAIDLLRETAAKVLVDHPVTALAAVHRSGSLAVGDLAVVCAAAAPHRAEAFAACRALIDTLKKQVPIWKREEFEDGSHIWVGS
jgi:molybdopterin synthase catalytic subunit